MSALLRGAVLGAIICASAGGPAIPQVATEGAAAGPMGYGFVQAGRMGMHLDGLNASLANAGLPTLDTSAPIWGGGGYGRVGRWYFGGVGHGGLDPASILDSRHISLKGGYGLARAKYRALRIGGLSLYPAVGLGAGSMTLQIADLATPTFEEVLDAPGRSSSLSTGVIFLLDAGMALDYSLVVGTFDDGGGWGVVLGVEAGYMYAPGGTSWTLDELDDVVGGPTLKIDGFYVWLSVGGWGREGDS
jgi:hypothetical protein